MLLRSPFLAGAGEERDARALVDVKLRNQRLWQISLDHLRSQCGSEVRRLLKALKALFGVLAEMEEKSASHAGWSRAFWSMLDAVGWPGDRLLNSREHQLLARWRDLLSEFAALDAVGGTVSLEGAVRRLRRLAASVIFQFEDRGAPIQISDAREAAGMRFDHVWIMGLHDEALPAPADPNPFVPISLQREYGAPNASAEHQFEGSRGLFERLASCAAEVVLSFPQTEGDRLMMPSPFLSARPESTAPPGSRWIARMRAAPAIETIVDENAPPVPEGVQRGGAYVLRDMAACPFRAFAAHRLGARELDGVEAGLSARDKGSALHRVMERIWREVGSQARLLSLSPEQISELIRRHIASVLDQYAGTTNAAVERIRLERLVTTWMRLERLRPDFKVAALEEKREVNIGGLRLEIRADRVDELTDGRRLILDYKSGEVKSKAWIGERPDEPQLPLYCVSANAPLAGAAFARIRAEGVEFAGIVESELPDFTDFGKNQPCLDEQLRHWRAVLSSLAERFGRGEAQVDPKYGRKTCEHCAIIPLCRIRERQSD
jgi:probable DNA repair protein